jgi:hypothetical protein
MLKKNDFPREILQPLLSLWHYLGNIHIFWNILKASSFYTRIVYEILFLFLRYKHLLFEDVEEKGKSEWSLGTKIIYYVGWEHLTPLSIYTQWWWLVCSFLLPPDGTQRLTAPSWARTNSSHLRSWSFFRGNYLTRIEKFTIVDELEDNVPFVLFALFGKT